MCVYYHKVLAKARELRIESIVKEQKNLINTYFMYLQDVHFITIAPFKIQSAPKIAKALAYLTDSNLNKTTVKFKKKIYTQSKGFLHYQDYVL